jgi:hypothetical protein
MLLLDYEFHPALGRYETLTSLDLFVTFQVASAPDHEIRNKNHLTRSEARTRFASSLSQRDAL